MPSKSNGSAKTPTKFSKKPSKPDQKATTNVIANFKQVIKEGDLRLHPIVTRLVDAEALEKMGASKGSS